MIPGNQHWLKREAPGHCRQTRPHPEDWNGLLKKEEFPTPGYRQGPEWAQHRWESGQELPSCENAGKFPSTTGHWHQEATPLLSRDSLRRHTAEGATGGPEVTETAVEGTRSSHRRFSPPRGCRGSPTTGRKRLWKHTPPMCIAAVAS